MILKLKLVSYNIILLKGQAQEILSLTPRVRAVERIPVPLHPVRIES